MTKDSDAERLAALGPQGRFAPPADPAFERLARLAAKVLNASAAMISRVDAGRHILECGIGLPRAWAGDQTNLL
ncbi:HWE histidine kinase domain-containing protein, partial [Singulisphaera rosea]